MTHINWFYYRIDYDMFYEKLLELDGCRWITDHKVALTKKKDIKVQELSMYITRFSRSISIFGMELSVRWLIWWYICALVLKNVSESEVAKVVIYIESEHEFIMIISW
jgi:hypothetical protein